MKRSEDEFITIKRIFGRISTTEKNNDKKNFPKRSMMVERIFLKGSMVTADLSRQKLGGNTIVIIFNEIKDDFGKV